jgi:hypothetical protein
MNIKRNPAPRRKVEKQDNNIQIVEKLYRGSNQCENLPPIVAQMKFFQLQCCRRAPDKVHNISLRQIQKRETGERSSKPS